MERTSNNTITLLDIDSEGIKPSGDVSDRPYYVEVPYVLRECKRTEHGIVEEQEVTETIGVKDTASLQAWLADVESAGFTLKKRKVIIDETTGEIAIDWQDATATDFVVIDAEALHMPTDTAIKANDDEFLEAVKMKYQFVTDLQALLVAINTSVTCLRIERETGATFAKTWQFEQIETINAIINDIHLGKFVFDLNGDTFKADITTCAFFVGD